MNMNQDVSSGDRGPMLVGVSWLLVSVSAAFLSLRIYCKFKRKRTPWWDDYILIFAWAFLLIDTCLLTVITSLGFGKHYLAIDPSVLPRIRLLGFVTSVFAIFSAIYSKTSFAVTLLRFSEGRTKILLWFIIISVNLALGGSALIPWIQCHPVDKNWNLLTPGKCWNRKISSDYGIVASAYSGAMDILLAFIPWKMMWNLQMKGKIGVATAMSMGVFAGGAAITKSVYNQLLASRDFSYDGANLVLWGQVESAICIIAVSIPVLRALIVEHVHSQERVTGETTGDIGLRTYATDTIGVRPPSFVFPEEEESNTTPTTTSEMVKDWMDGSHDALL